MVAQFEFGKNRTEPNPNLVGTTKAKLQFEIQWDIRIREKKTRFQNFVNSFEKKTLNLLALNLQWSLIKRKNSIWIQIRETTRNALTEKKGPLQKILFPCTFYYDISFFSISSHLQMML